MKTNLIINTKNGQESLVATLTSLVFQSTKNFKVIIYDTSDVGIFSNNTIQRLLAALTHETIQVQYHRALGKQNIARDRFNALKQCDNDCEYVIFVDDDSIVKPNGIELLIQSKEDHRDIPFIQGCIMDSENIRGYDDYYQPEHTCYNVNLNLIRSYLYAKWKDDLEVPLLGESCSNAFVIFEKKMLDEIKAYSDYESVDYAEDNMVGIKLEKKYGEPILRTGAFSYHLPKSNKRRWDDVVDNQLRSLYKKVI